MRTILVLLLVTAAPPIAEPVNIRRPQTVLPAITPSLSNQSSSDVVPAASQQAASSPSSIGDEFSGLINGTSSSLFNATALTDKPTVECARGSELSASQCHLAISSVPDFPDLFTHRISWGPRELGIHNVGLPRLYLSRTFPITKINHF